MKLTAKAPEKWDGWKMVPFLLGQGTSAYFQGQNLLLVLGRGHAFFLIGILRKNIKDQRLDPMEV